MNDCCLLYPDPRRMSARPCRCLTCRNLNTSAARSSPLTDNFDLADARVPLDLRRTCYFRTREPPSALPSVFGARHSVTSAWCACTVIKKQTTRRGQSQAV